MTPKTPKVVNTENSEIIFELIGPSWRLPILVDFPHQNDMARVRLISDLPLLKLQRQAIADLLGTYGSYDKTERQWWILKNTLLHISAPSQQSDPEAVVRWNPSASQKPSFADDAKTVDNEAFYQSLVDSGHFSTTKQAKVLWTVFCKSALDQLLNWKRPIHMLFCKLWPLPYRTNWKQVVMQTDMERNPVWKQPYTEHCKAVGHGQSAGAWVSKTGVEERIGDLLVSGDILAFEPPSGKWTAESNWKHQVHDEHIWWSIEVEYCPLWKRTSKEMEQRTRRLAPLQRRHYPFAVVQTLKYFQPYGARLYSLFLEQIAIPNCILITAPTNDYVCQLREPKSYLRSGIYSPRNLPHVYVSFQTQDAGASGDLPPETGVLPAMPDLRSGTPPVRAQGHDLVESDYAI